MVLNWKTEEQVLFHSSKIIARAWRMNRRQLYFYCMKLRKNQPQVLPGPLGCAFLAFLEQICRQDTAVPVNVWPDLMQDVRRLQKLIQEHRHLDRERWLAALPKLEAGQDYYFRTGLGRVFVRVIKEKTGVYVPAQKQPSVRAKENPAAVRSGRMAGTTAKKRPDSSSENPTAVRSGRMAGTTAKKRPDSSSHGMNPDDDRNLREIAVWLTDQPKAASVPGRIRDAAVLEHPKQAAFAGRLKQAAVPILACVSLCFMAVWLQGQVTRNQNKWNIRQMKTAAAEEADTFLSEHEALEADTVKHDGALPDADLSQKGGQTADKQHADMQADSNAQPQIRTASGIPSKIQAQADEPPNLLPQYREMSEEYPQLYGWLQIPGTEIDLPVMQPEADRDFYLHHDFTGAESAEGTLFVDPESSSYPKDDNTVVYGHNMKNGHIFGMLNRYGNVDFFEEHRTIQFDTLYETGTYEAVAVVKTRILNENEPGFRYYQCYQYKNQEEFQECLDFVEANRLFETDTALRYGDQILMLSTCEYSQENGRLVVVARKSE